MGKASSMSDNTEWDLEETILQVKQNVPIDLRTIARETTNDKKLLKLWLAQKTKIYRKRQNTGPIQRTRKTSNQFHVVFYDEKVIISSFTTYGDHTIAQGPPGDQQKDSISKAVLVTGTNKGDTHEERRIYCCKMASNSRK